MRYFLSLFTGLTFLFAAFIFLSHPQPILSRHDRGVSLPPSAKRIKPGLYELQSPPISPLKGYVIVAAENSTADDRLSTQTNLKQCYTFIGEGSIWREPEPYLINPVNQSGLGPKQIHQIFAESIAQWEDATDGRLNGKQSFDLSTTGLAIFNDGPDFYAPDGLNEVIFAPINYPGAVAITVVWGIWEGPIEHRQIVEWDQVYNDTLFRFSLDQTPGTIDLKNIVMHELGHSFGMGDLYNPECNEATMYGYTYFGETRKRDLSSGDLHGFKVLHNLFKDAGLSQR